MIDSSNPGRPREEESGISYDQHFTLEVGDYAIQCKRFLAEGEGTAGWIYSFNVISGNVPPIPFGIDLLKHLKSCQSYKDPAIPTSIIFKIVPENGSASGQPNVTIHVQLSGNPHNYADKDTLCASVNDTIQKINDFLSGDVDPSCES